MQMLAVEKRIVYNPVGSLFLLNEGKVEGGFRPIKRILYD